MPELSICVLHYNRWDLTRDCLASIDAQDIPCTHEKLLIDNGSTIPFRAPEGWRLVRYHDNRGHIVGQNRCFESAQGEWVLFVANDVRLEQNCLKHLWESKDQELPEGKFWIRQPRLYRIDRQIDNEGLNWFWPGYGLAHRWNLFSHPTSFSGSCYLMRKRIWNELQGFDENLETSHEDIDFALRARKRHYLVESEWTAQALHIGNATLSHQASHTRDAFHRDRLYLLRKHYAGLDYWLRYLAVQTLDHLPHPSTMHQRSA